MYILLIVLLILFLIPAIILSFVSWILSLFGIRSKKRRPGMDEGFFYTSDNSRTPHAEEPKHNQMERRKIFDKDEGEYVDFEEIK